MKFVVLCVRGKCYYGELRGTLFEMFGAIKTTKIVFAMTYDNNFGNVRVGTVVITCPQSSVPIPKNKHHSHCSRVSSLVENAILPYWMMTTCSGKENVLFASRS